MTDGGAMGGEGPWRRYFLCCTEGTTPRWWDRFFKPGFRHCYVLIWDGACWLYVDPTLHRMHVSILDHYENRHPAEWTEDPYATVIEVEVQNPERLRAPWCVGPLTCVETSKALLGIRSFWLWSPWRLYRYVEKHHGYGRESTEENSRGRSPDASADARARAHAGGNQREEAPHPSLANRRAIEPAEWQ